jgi:DNA-binding NtrC family response regulator
VTEVSKKAMLVLKSYEWPGNVRELENVIERAVMLARGTELRPENLFLPGAAHNSGVGRVAPPGQGVGDSISVAELEKLHILGVLKECGGNQKNAAAILGISKSTLWRKLKEYGMDASSLA